MISAITIVVAAIIILFVPSTVFKNGIDMLILSLMD
jgi:hypothetical protein